MDILNNDRLARIDIENAELYDLDDICDENSESLNNTEYMGPEVRFFKNHRNNHKIYSTKYVISRFYEQYPYLVGVDLSNLYIAGGAISQFVKHSFVSPDIDIFVYGLNAKQANTRIVKFINDVELNIYTKYNLILAGRKHGFGSGYGDDTGMVANTIAKSKAKFTPDLKYFTLSKTSDISSDEWDLFTDIHLAHYPESSIISSKKIKFDLYVHKSHSVITDYSATVDFGFTNTKIQLISRLYNTKKEILYGFDLGSCAVGFDGESIEFSLAGKFAQEYNLNILDTTRFSLNHNARLKKYFDRGYGVIFPLCKRNYQTNRFNINYIRFYNITFKYESEGDYNSREFPYKYNVKMYTNNSGSDYGCDEPTFTETKELIYLKNTIFKLVNGYKGFYIYSDFYTVRQFSTMFTRLPTINLLEIEKFYKFMHVNVWKDGKLDMKTLTSYIPEFNFAEFASIVKSRSESPSKYIRNCATKQFDNLKKKVLLLDIDGNPHPYLGIKWTTCDVMSQKSLLTGSFHPVYMDNKKFYTEKYYSDEQAELLIA